MSWIVANFGGALNKRLKGFEGEQRQNPLLGPYWRDNFPIEIELGNARLHFHNTSRYPQGSRFDVAYGFAVGAMRIYQALPSVARERFLGRLKGAMKDQFGLRPIAYELRTAIHLMKRGYDVTFSDLIGAGRSDFIAAKDGEEIDVECKTTSVDTGRKIHRKQLHTLSRSLLPIVDRLLIDGGGHLVQLTVRGRLENREPQVAALTQLFSSGALAKSSVKNETGSFAYRRDSSGKTFTKDTDETMVRAVLCEAFGDRNGHALFRWRENCGFVAIAIESDEPDTVLESIAEQAKDAADQCSGARPAVLAIQLVEMDRDALKKLLETASGVHLIAHAVFRSQQRSFVDSIGFSIAPDAHSETDFATSRELGGDVATLFNPAPRFPCEAARSIFSPPDRAIR